MTWPPQGKTDLEPNFPHCVLDDGEWHTVDHPPFLSAQGASSNLCQSSKAGWAGERLAAFGDPQVRGGTRDVRGGIGKKRASEAFRKAGVTRACTRTMVPTVPPLQKASLTMKVPAPRSSRGKAEPASLLSESNSRKENFSRNF